MDIRTKYYGRKTSRAMKAGAKNVYDELYEKYRLCHLEMDLVFQEDDTHHKPTILEIGFGMGDFLAHQALLFPDKSFIGVEPFKTGIVSLLKKIQEHNIQNIRIHHGVIYDVLDQMPSLEAAYILYPDPWPKKRHNKRRVVQVELLKTLAKKLMPGGTINIVSDHADYQEWIKNIVKDPLLPGADSALQFDLSKWQMPFPNWIPTKYEKKAIKEGRIPHYFHGVDSSSR